MFQVDFLFDLQDQDACLSALCQFLMGIAEIAGSGLQDEIIGVSGDFFEERIYTSTIDNTRDILLLHSKKILERGLLKFQGQEVFSERLSQILSL